jgi:hypothetical protein
MVHITIKTTLFCSFFFICQLPNDIVSHKMCHYI